MAPGHPYGFDGEPDTGIYQAHQDLFVPHRIVKVGMASTDDAQQIVPADTVKDPVGRAAIAKATEDVRDLPNRERRHKIIKVGVAGERTLGLSAGANELGGKVVSMVPDAIGDVYPGEHRYAYQIEVGDRIMNLGKATPEMGRWVKVLGVELIVIDGIHHSAEFLAISEAGYRLTMSMDANAQLRLVTNQEEPYG